MIRCVLLAALASTSLLATAPAAAQIARNFPATALRGQVLVTQAPELLLNGRPARLAPGARLHGPDNLLLVSSALQGQRLLVNYTLDANGNLLEVWVLNSPEAERRPWPTTPQDAARWQFDWASQTWSTP